MIESSSFGGSLSRLWIAERAADGVSAATDTDVNGLMRANRTAGLGGKAVKTGGKFLAS